MGDKILETIDLKKYFMTKQGPLHAVDGINLSIERENPGVVGESGCGKSTLGRAILRLIPEGEGKVLFEGTDLYELTKSEMNKYRRHLQIIFQDPYSSLNPRMSIFDLIAYPLRVNRIYKNRNELRDRVLPLWDLVGLSKGMLILTRTN